MANTPKQDSSKKDTTSQATGPVQERRVDQTSATQKAQDSRGAGRQAREEDSEPTESDRVRDEIKSHEQAIKDNPDHPEEAVETQYLEGGEIPATAPGTEGMPRE